MKKWMFAGAIVVAAGIFADSATAQQPTSPAPQVISVQDGGSTGRTGLFRGRRIRPMTSTSAPPLLSSTGTTSAGETIVPLSSGGGGRVGLLSRLRARR